MSVESYSKSWYQYPSDNGTIYRIRLRDAPTRYGGLVPAVGTEPILPVHVSARRIFLWSDNPGSNYFWHREVVCSPSGFQSLLNAGVIPDTNPLDGLAWTVFSAKAERNWDGKLPNFP